ncbi:esterase/lipase family protein [Nakamurella lactea]|uniref:esterase/lipase family protein n=1 Tax=Nakamurella lactea TaxID=459515 RepID=UPI0003FF22F2|nr:hypothetical protein [Nakamurella lactea]
MAADELRFSWPDGAGTATSTAQITPDDSGNSLPVVVLLHGNNGDINDMRDPGATSSPYNYRRIAEETPRDHGWHWYPNLGGIWGFSTGQLMPVKGWEPSLVDAGYPTVNYSQVDHRDRLTRPAAELRALLTALDAHPMSQDRDVVIVAHSRGGVLARLVLVDLQRDADAGSVEAARVLSRVTKLVTLHTPNAGSGLANMAIETSRRLMESDARTAGSWLFNAINPVYWFLIGRHIDALIDMIRAETDAPAYEDFRIGSPTLAALAAAEPVPGIEYYSFGGTTPFLSWLGVWQLSPLAAVPQGHTPPFHWESKYRNLTRIPPEMGGLPPELTYGEGDVLVSAARAHLPFSVRTDNSLNHAQVLWDPTVKLQVMSFLTTGKRLAPVPILTDSYPRDHYITSIRPDTAADPDSTIDAYCGVRTDGQPWEVNAARALTLMRHGHRFYARNLNGETSSVVAVTLRASGRVYLRTAPYGRATLNALPHTSPIPEG